MNEAETRAELIEPKLKESVIERTTKMFYVCCSRVKKNLVVFYHKPSSKVLEKAKNWFGSDNLIKVSE